MISKPANPVLALLNLCLGLFFLLFFLLLIPWKLPAVNLAFLVLGAAVTAGGAGLWFSRRWAARLLAGSAWWAIGLGAVLITLSLTAMSWLSGVYDSLGKTASGLFLFVILIIAVLLLLLPGLELYHLRPLRRK